MYGVRVLRGKNLFSNSFKSMSTSRSPEDVLKEYLLPCQEVVPPPRVTLEDFVAKSEEFPVPFPVHTARVKTFLKNEVDKDELEDKINSTYPVIHERLLPLLATFIDKKKQFGRKREKELYASMTLLELVDRLLKKRPIVFFNPIDHYLLRNGVDNGCEGFEDIGHSHESPRLGIANYMSYDEIKLAALVAVSSKSFFINDGSRQNRGIAKPSDSFQKEGVIVGLVGARFERPEVMEYQDCAISVDQNKKSRGYGSDPPEKRWLIKEWGRLWNNATLPTWEEAVGPGYAAVSSVLKLNNNVYKARIQISSELLLIEAASRAAAEGLKAYVHVVGLGLGVWQLCDKQIELFVEAFGDALAVVDTTHIEHVDFSWIPVTSCHGVGNGEKFPNTDVTLHFSKRALHDTVPEGTFLVDSYAWDGNSLPGNEYWRGMLSSSGDPAAACSSQVAELHNAMINPLVTGENLHIASSKGIEHISQYAKRFLD